MLVLCSPQRGLSCHLIKCLFFLWYWIKCGATGMIGNMSIPCDHQKSVNVTRHAYTRSNKINDGNGSYRCHKCASAKSDREEVGRSKIKCAERQVVDLGCNESQ